MAELVDALDSKSSSFGSVGSIPTQGTQIIRNLMFYMKLRIIFFSKGNILVTNADELIVILTNLSYFGWYFFISESVSPALLSFSGASRIVTVVSLVSNRYFSKIRWLIKRTIWNNTGSDVRYSDRFMDWGGWSRLGRGCYIFWSFSMKLRCYNRIKFFKKRC